MATRGESIESRKIEFEFEELRKFTNDFSDDQKLGVSQFGTLYKGIKEDGSVIAVKKLDDNPNILPNMIFENELKKIMALKHENVVEVVGFCKEDVYVPELKKDISESLLCYEYFPNGDLEGYLFGIKDYSPAEAGTSKATEEFSLAEPSTDWDTRFKIINGICHGLLFLHNLESPIIHMDLKLGNIWLGKNRVPKIGNFGLSRLLGKGGSRMVTENVVGSFGHMAPEYLYRGEISTKVDIYSLGLLIIEITTGEKNCPMDNQPSARQYLTKIRTNWTAEHIASEYASLDAERLHQIHSCIKIGLECVEIDRNNRPPIEKVVDELNAV